MSVGQIIIGIIIIIGLSYAVFHRGPSQSANQGYGENQQPAAQTGGNPAAGGSYSSGSGGKTSAGTGTKPPAPAPAAAIKVLIPAAGDVLAINHVHNIAWTKPAGFTGYIELINSSTGEVAGVVSANTTVTQDFFPWDTRDVFLSRASSSRTNLNPGSYKLEIIFDRGLAPIESGVFSIVPEAGKESVTPLSRIQDKKITPNNISVARGAKIIFMNNDSVTHQIYGNGIASFDIAPGGYYSFDTSVLAAGIYTAYSNIYTYLSPVTLTVK